MTTNERLPALIDTASNALASARTAAEVLDAKDKATFAFDAAKAAARFAKAKAAHTEIIEGMHKLMANALHIESQADCRLADEYDAAQARGEVAKHGGHLPKRKVAIGDLPPTAADIGLTKQQVHKARKVRDAEKKNPGAVRRALDEKVKTKDGPSRADVKRAVSKPKPKATPVKAPPPPPKPKPEPEPRKSTRGRNTPKLDAAIAIVSRMMERGEPISPHKLQDEHGISHVTFDMAITFQNGWNAALKNQPLDRDELPRTAQEKLDSTIRHALRKLEAEFEDKVQAECRRRIEETILPHYNEKYAEFNQVVKARKGIMSAANFKTVRNCLHPDRFAFLKDDALTKRMDEAFNLFNSLELALVNEKERPTHGFNMPKTYAEAMALKAKVAANRRAKRATNPNNVTHR